MSSKGRDKGKLYVVVKEIDEYFLLISDGDKKKLSNPKRKNRKHIEVLDGEIKVTDPFNIANEEIKNILKCHYKEVGLPNVKR